MIGKRNIPALFLDKYKNSPSDRSIGWIEADEIKFLTNENYFEIVATLSLGLEECGVRAGNKVSILADTSQFWHFTDLAILCLSAVVVPLYPTYTAFEISFIINHSESNFLVIDNETQLNKILEINKDIIKIDTIITLSPINEKLILAAKEFFTIVTYEECLVLGKNILDKSPERFEEHIDSIQDQSLASIIYTSGTTGSPKGAMIRQNAFWSMLNNIKISLTNQINHTDRSLISLPLSHVLGRCDSMLGLALGHETIYGRNLNRILDDVAITKPTIMISVPRIFEKIYLKIKTEISLSGRLKQKAFSYAEKISNSYFSYLDSDQSPPSSLLLAREIVSKSVYAQIYKRFGGRIRFFVSGGAPLNTRVIKFLRNANLTTLEGYGLTETVAPCCLNPIAKQVTGTVGLPLGDTQINFAKDNEILIKSTALFDGYYKNQKETDEVMNNGWFKTGDIGELTAQGHLKITDRKKNIIITSGGKNISPQKIEELLTSGKFITHIMVIGDRRNFLSAIIGIEKDSFMPYLERLGLQESTSISEIVKNPEVNKLISNEIDFVNNSLAKFENIKRFYIAPHQFDHNSGLITPSLKLKKEEILKRFEKEINAMYD